MRNLVYLILYFLVTGCGLGLDNSGDFIDDFGIQSYAVDSDSYAAISPSVNEGNFLVEWKIDRTSEYDIGLFIEPDKNLILKNHSIIDKQCDAENDDITCESNLSVECFFTTDLQIECPDLELISDDLSSILFDLPKTIYFALVVCDSVTAACDNEIIPVTFYRNRQDLLIGDLISRPKLVNTGSSL